MIREIITFSFFSLKKGDGSCISFLLLYRTRAAYTAELQLFTLWRLEVKDQGVATVGPAEGCEREPVPASVLGSSVATFPSRGNFTVRVCLQQSSVHEDGNHTASRTILMISLQLGYLWKIIFK